MATSGTVKTNTKYGSYFWVKWEISGSQDIAGNKTTISWSCGLHPKEQYYTNAIKMSAVVINGKTVYSGGTYSDIKDYKDHTFASGTLDIPHNNDGSKTFTVSAFSGWLYGNGDYTASAESFALPAIPRAATITSAPNFTDVDNPAIAYANPAGSAVSALDVCISLTGSASDIAYRAVSTSGGSYTFQLTNAERAVLRNNTTLTRKVVFQLRTKIGSTYYYDTVERTFTVTNNAATRPSEAIAVAPVSALSAPFNALYIQGRTQAKIKHTASGKFGATIKQYSASVEGKAYSGETATSNALQTPGELTITGKATDSRGFSTTAAKNVTVLAYNTPSVVRNGSTRKFVCTRATSDGAISEDGTALYVECSKSFAYLAGNNKCTLRLRYAAEGGGWSSWITLLAESSGNNYAGVVPGVTLSVSVVYTIEIQAVDKLGESGSSKTRIPTSEMTFHLGENGKAVGIGRYASESGEKRLDVAWNAHFEKGLQVGGASELGSHMNQMVTGNPWYGLNDGTNQWHLQALQDSNKLALGLTWDSSLKIDTNGNVTLPANLTGKYITGTWLQSTEATDLGKAPPYVCVFDASGWLYKRTLAELFADMGIPAQKDYVVERGTRSSWHYEKWNSGKLELWRQTTSSNMGTTGQTGGWYYRAYTVALPSGLLKTIQDVQCNCVWGTGVSFASGSADTANFKAIYFSNQNGGAGTFWHRITGTWK